MTAPDELPSDDGGWWARREVFVEEVVADYPDDDDVDFERVDRLVDELIEEGTVEEQTLHGEPYVRGVSRRALAQSWMKYKGRSLADKTRRRILGGEDE